MPDTGPTRTARITLRGPKLAGARRTEWLLTNGLGGFAMGTPFLTPERKYHALLIGALTPPVGRIAALNAVDERLVIEVAGGNGCAGLRRLNLSDHRFIGSDPAAPRDFDLLQFEHQGDMCVWKYRASDPTLALGIERRLSLTPGRNACRLEYIVEAPKRRSWFELRPLISLRDFHAVMRVDRQKFAHSVWWDEAALNLPPVTIQLGGYRLKLQAAGGRGGRFVSEHAWWYNFEYIREAERHQEAVEDLFCPGAFVVEVTNTTTTRGESPAGVSLLAWMDDEPPHAVESVGLSRRTPDRLDPHEHHDDADEHAIAALTVAARQFIVRREPTTTDQTGDVGCSIIAGYPWFSDWGRDTFIALPGLLLCTGRWDDARATLESFGKLRRRGLIPNCFDNRTATAEYNTVDASLWYLQAAASYLKITGDRPGFSGIIKETCLAIVHAYRSGTDFGIRMNPRDGLIEAGDPTLALTWMDAKRDGIVFTPRHGRAVEIQALWCSGLMLLADAVESDQPRTARELRQVAELAGRSFKEQFWDDSRKCLYDVLAPSGSGWEPRRETRPNQIFAVSLAYSPLYPEQQRAVLACVRDRLLTDRGLRTLEASDAKYEGRYEGSMLQRDAAYHNGTVWPWLLGPYAEAVLRVGDWKEPARLEARRAITPLLLELLAAGDTAPASLLSLPEVYDGDDTAAAPRRADGCPAQAWSVAELLRIMTALKTAPPDPTPAR